MAMLGGSWDDPSTEVDFSNYSYSELVALREKLIIATKKKFLQEIQKGIYSVYQIKCSLDDISSIYVDGLNNLEILDRILLMRINERYPTLVSQEDFEDFYFYRLPIDMRTNGKYL